MKPPDRGEPHYRAAAIIVLFCPAEEQLVYFKRVISKYLHLYFVDNTPPGQKCNLEPNNRIKILYSKDNGGIAYGLNAGIKEAAKDGFRLFFLFDQDTIVDQFYIETMFHCYNRYVMDEKLGYIVPNFFDRNSHSFANYPVLSKYTFRHADCKNRSNFLKLNAGTVIAITSGMLIDYHKYMLIGRFREDLFIDFVDNEYALKASLRGLKIKVCCEAIIDHSIGSRENKKFLGVTFKPNHHNAIRRYFISRNGMRIAIEYLSKYPAFSILFTLRILHEALSILLFEEAKHKKMQMIVSGLISGIRGDMDHERMVDSLNKS